MSGGKQYCGVPLPKEPSWGRLHGSLAEVRTLCTDVGAKLRALAEVLEEMSDYGGKDEFQRGSAWAYAQAAKEIRLVLGDEE